MRITRQPTTGRAGARRATAVLSAVFALLLAGCGGSGSTADHSMSGSSDHMSGTAADQMPGGHDGASKVADGARVVKVAATSFAFSPETITVTAGEDVAISLTSTDKALHDFTVDELDAHVAAKPGKTATGGLRADTPGTYTFYCSVVGHRAAGMTGTLVVNAAG